MNSPVYVLGTGLSGRGESLEKAVALAQLNPAFRKASRNVLIANLAIQAAMQNSTVATADFRESGFVLGSSYGELENTSEFLRNWVRSKLARPMIFQSSLHNGTLGFLALHLSLPGPSFTVSQRFLTGEKSLELGADLIRGKMVDLVIVSAVDVMAPSLFEVLQPHLPAQVKWADGAAAVVLASKEFVTARKLKPLAEFGSVVFENGKNSPQISGQFYDSDGLEKWIGALQDKSAGELINGKLDQSSAHLTWKPVHGV